MKMLAISTTTPEIMPNTTCSRSLAFGRSTFLYKSIVSSVDVELRTVETVDISAAAIPARISPLGRWESAS